VSRHPGNGSAHFAPTPTPQRRLHERNLALRHQLHSRWGLPLRASAIVSKKAGAPSGG